MDDIVFLQDDNNNDAIHIHRAHMDEEKNA